MARALPPISIQQILTTVLFQQVGDNPHEYNSYASHWSDFMAMHNLAFAHVTGYRARIDAIVKGNKIKPVISGLYENREPTFGDLLDVIASIYNNSLMENIRYTPEMVKLAFTSSDPVVSLFSDSKHSSHPTLTELSYVNNALLAHYTKTEVTHASYSLALTTATPKQRRWMVKVAIMFGQFKKLANDPLYGDGHYGVLPYMFPAFDPDDLSDERLMVNEGVTAAYLGHLIELASAFREMKHQRDALDNHKNNLDIAKRERIEWLNLTLPHVDLSADFETQSNELRDQPDKIKILEEMNENIQQRTFSYGRQLHVVDDIEVDKIATLIEATLTAFIQDYSKVMPAFPKEAEPEKVEDDEDD